MNYLDFLYQKNQTGQPGVRMPLATYGDGMGVRMPSPTYGDGLGLDAPASFGNVSGAASGSMMNPMAIMSLLQQAQPKVQEIPQMNIPAGSNLSYEQLMKMYGVQGLLG